MNTPIYILGGYQTDFAKNYARLGIGIDGLIKEALDEGLAQTRLPVDLIDVAHVGNFVGELFCQQGHLGGLLAEVNPAFNGLPISRHEAACASGSMALLAAMADLEAGRYEVACVLGVEYMRNVGGDKSAEYLGAAAWAGHEAQNARYVWPFMFDQLVDEYERRYGLDYAHLMEIAKTNFLNAKHNPNAQTRDWQFTDKSFTADDEANPVTEGRIRRQDCGQISDGAAVVFLASEEKARDYARGMGVSLSSLPRIQGWGHRTARMSYQGKLNDSEDQPLIFPHVAGTIADAFSRARISSVFDLDVIETHDCFSITEYMAIDHFGITAPGKSWQAIEEGWIRKDGKLPINPSGGLMGLGHPVGATGVRMMLDAYKQLCGQAGDYQVAGARKVATLNIGGSTTTTASFVVGI